MSLFLVTGGAGFIGSHLTAALLQRNDRVRVLDNFATGKRSNIELFGEAVRNGALEVVQGDVREADTVRHAMKGVDYVLHLAAVVSVPQSMVDPLLTHIVNVEGTLNVLTAARHFDVKRVVLSSSCAVYGDNDDLPLKETSLTRPLSPYAATKLMGEIYCQTYQRAYGLPTACLRYFNIYGPRQDPNGEYAAVIPKFIERMKAGQAPTIFGDGEQTRDFVHVSDVVRANLLACWRDEAIGRVFNVGSGSGVSLLQLVDALNQIQDRHIAPQFAPERLGDIRHSRGDGSYSAAVLGFTPQMSLIDGLRGFYE
ncbi:MAG: SDR family oxidoreductase [Chloroflexi bacterium]|nr:SDR family oxidoreductase [Chloroflexota bacterium]